MQTLMGKKEILNLEEACQLIGLSISRGYKVYFQWRDYGVRILKYAPTARPRFYRKDILRMLEARK